MRKRIKKIAEFLKKKCRKINERIGFRFTSEKNLGNPMDLENQMIIGDEQKMSPKKKKWLPKLPKKVQKLIAILVVSIVIVRARPTLGSISVKSLPPFERLVPVANAVGVEGFQITATPSAGMKRLASSKGDFESLFSGNFREFKKSNIIDQVTYNAKKIQVAVRRSTNAKLDRLLREEGKSHFLYLEKLKNEGKTLKTLINPKNFNRIVILRPDLDERILGSRIKLTKKIYHLEELGLKPDANYNQTFVQKSRKEEVDIYWYFKKFKDTMGKSYMEFALNLVGDLNNYPIKVKFEVKRYENEPEKIGDAIVFLDPRTLEIVLCRPNFENPLEYNIISSYPQSDDQVIKLLEDRTCQ